MSLPEPIEMLFFLGNADDGSENFCATVNPSRNLMRPTHRVLVTFIEEVPPCKHEDVQPFSGILFRCMDCGVEMAPTSFAPKQVGNGSN